MYASTEASAFDGGEMFANCVDVVNRQIRRDESRIDVNKLVAGEGWQRQLDARRSAARDQKENLVALIDEVEKLLTSAKTIVVDVGMAAWRNDRA